MNNSARRSLLIAWVEQDGTAASYDIIDLGMKGVGAWDGILCIMAKIFYNYLDSRKNKT